ncbi:uncharacterized protein LOC131680655 [Topomyia yanbarensis]|uniref:uncharacterized protein LOC131680655 n=1 Tax=Topomyia yanbarensis TaxID=2498891 RepID=UPI00273C5D78|nr:uncharacterized protein LOC131680655 [Topomyia yanbarensis]
MDETKLLKIILLSLLCKTTLGAPFTFPDSSRTESNRSREATPSRQSEFEGRSIRGGYGPQKFSDYSRYNVYEHEYDDFRRSTTTVGPFLTTTRQSYNNRQPNAYYNRLPPPKNDEPIEVEAEDDYSDENVEDVPDPVTSKPGTASAADYSSSGYGSRPSTFNNLFFNANDKFFGLGNLFGEDRRKHKFKFKRRKPGQPCIPYDLFNKLRLTGRDAYGNRIDPKTLYPPLNLVLADVNYYSPSNNYNGQGGSHDTGTGGGAIFNNNFYDAVGGYPCTSANFGHKPHKPHKPHGGGPLGFFGQGGLFDWAPSADAVQSDTGEGGTGGGGSSNRPTVVFNLNDAIDTVATNWKPGESFQNMMKVIAEFITSVAGGVPAAAGEVVGDTVDTVRKVNSEFVSLFT